MNTAIPIFPKRQIAAVTALCRGIQTRNNIPAVRVLAHSDVAPGRKQDPGEKFPWQTLYDSGVGHWVNPAPITEGGGVLLALGDRGDNVAAMQKSLGQYGYGVSVNGNYDSIMHDVVTAFQRHFRPERVDGVSDQSTRATLRDLLATRGRVQDHCRTRPRLRAPRLLTAAANVIIPFLVSRSDGRSGETERLPGRKVRAPWTSGAG